MDKKKTVFNHCNGNEIDIRPAAEIDYDFILRVNEENVEVLAPMDKGRLIEFMGMASLIWIASVNKERAAFLIALTEGASSYDSENYLWFKNHYAHFLYIDRIVIDAPFRGMDIGKKLYQKAFDHANEHGIPVVTAEIDTIPYNEASLKFHKAMGFEEVGEQFVRGGSVKVSLQAAKVNDMDSNRNIEHEYIDMGLSVKWATMNIGAARISDYGDYFAWGETISKEDYTWGAYKYGTSADDLTKYNYEDDLMTLEPADDAARLKLGEPWRIPGRAEWEELCNKCNCIWEWTEIEGTPGYKVTSKITDNSIFLPAAGYFRKLAIEGQEKSGYYWSSTRNEPFPDRGICLFFIPNFIGIGNNGFRNGGFTIRPVK